MTDIRTGFQPPADGVEVLGASGLRYDAFLRLVKETKGLGGSDAKRFVFADQYPGANMVAKIHAAASDLGSAGGVVLIPPGTHTDCDTFEPADGIIYQGAGRTKTALRAVSGASYVVNAVNKSGFIIRDLTFQGYSVATHGSYLYNSSGIWEHVRFIYQHRLDLNACISNFFYNCLFQEAYYEALRVRGNTTAGNTFVACQFHRAGLYADDTYAAVRIQDTSHDNVFHLCEARYWGTPRQKYGFQVASGCQRNQFIGGKCRGNTDDWSDTGTDTMVDVIHSINGRQNLGNKRVEVATDFLPPRVSQSAQPTPAVGSSIIWHDTDDDKVYWVYNDAVAGVKKVELA